MPIETTGLLLAVDEFATQMKLELLRKVQEGYRGWNDDSDPDVEDNVKQLLDKHITRVIENRNADSCIDAANLLMFLERFYRKVKP